MAVFSLQHAMEVTCWTYDGHDKYPHMGCICSTQWDHIPDMPTNMRAVSYGLIVTPPLFALDSASPKPGKRRRAMLIIFVMAQCR